MLKLLDYSFSDTKKRGLDTNVIFPLVIEDFQEG